MTRRLALSGPRLAIAAGLAAAVVIGAAIATVAFISNRDYHAAELRVDQSNDFIVALGAILNTELDVETGARGYALTGDESFLEPYHNARQQLDARFTQIEGLHPGQQQADEVARLRSFTDQRLALAGQMIDARRNQGAAAAAAIVASGQGKDVMDSLRTLAGSLQTSETANLQNRLSAASGGEDTALATMLALAVVDALLVGAVVLLGTRELRRRTRVVSRALSTARARYNAIGEALAFGVWATGPGGEMEYVSPAFLDLTGLSPEQTAGDGWAAALDPAVRQATLHDWHAAVATRRPWTYELQLVGRDGEPFTALSRSLPVFNDAGELEGYAGINLDISDRKEMEDALRRANAAKDEFLGLVSHELRSPLTAILGNASILRRGSDNLPPAERDECTAEISQHAQRLQRLIENMLLLAREDHGHAYEPEPLLVQRTVAAVVENHRKQYPATPVEVSVEDGMAPVMCEPTFFEQVLTNLLSNAAKYSPAGAPISVSVSTPGGRLAVTVADRGHGVSPEEVEAVFTPFFRSQRTASMASGIGLGLAVCKRLVDAMGGEMFLRPRPGGGTEAGFTLPLELAREAAHDRPAMATGGGA